MKGYRLDDFTSLDDRRWKHPNNLGQQRGNSKRRAPPTPSGTTKVSGR
jgi:hypothetical protein